VLAAGETRQSQNLADLTLHSEQVRKNSRNLVAATVLGDGRKTAPDLVGELPLRRSLRCRYRFRQ
jgi:hypothetical protein